jgi:LuxR family maltose regulon positive regulatory protein
LSEANLFVIPLDDRHTWYRYHSLFARALRATLERDELAALHRAAMRWYESAGWMEQAVHHALAYMAITGDTLDAERLVRIASEAMVQQGQVLTVSRWLDALGDDCVQADGELATYRGWVLAITGDLAGAAAVASIAASHYRHGARSGELRDRAPREKLGKLRALGSFIALLREEDNAAAVALAREALTLLPETTVSWRILALWSQAEGLERMNRVAETVETLQEARRIAHTMHETLFAIMVEVSLAKLLNDQGRRRDAVAVCRAALERYTDEAGHPLPLAGFLLAHLGMLHYEANHLEKARHCHQQAADLGERLGLTLEAVYVRGLAAPTLYATGETGAALAALREGYRHAQETGYADPTWFAAWEVNVRLWEGDLVFARHWAERAGLSPQERPQLLTLEQHLTYARVLLAQQRIDEARHWLARLSEFTRTHGLYRWLISTEVLLALAADRLGDRGTAHDFLIRALTAAAPEDYVRPFLTEGPRVIALVQDLRGVNPAFVDHLLAQASGAEAPPGSPPTMVASPVEPLTDREREVMALIAAGLSNREIAEDLVIAVGTVKRHINHIYDKLQVHRRTEAVARARDLGIL